MLRSLFPTPSILQQVKTFLSFSSPLTTKFDSFSTNIFVFNLNARNPALTVVAIVAFVVIFLFVFGEVSEDHVVADDAVGILGRLPFHPQNGIRFRRSSQVLRLIGHCFHEPKQIK